MVFQEPKIEFIPINLRISADSSQAGIETCTGPEAPSHKCPEYNVMWLDSSGNDYYPN